MSSIATAQSGISRSDTSLINSYIEDAVASQGDSAKKFYNLAIQVAEKSIEKGGNKFMLNVVQRQLIKARYSLGLLYFNQMEYSKALDMYNKAFEEAQNIKDNRLQADGYFNIAEVYLEQSQFSKAIESYNLANDEYIKVKDISSQFWCLIGIGIVHKQSGNYLVSVQFYNRALEKAIKAGFTYEQAICYNNLGNVYRKLGEFSKAMEAYQKAIEVFRILKDENAISDCLNNIGNLYLDNGDPFRALDYYKQSVVINEKNKDEYRLIIRYKNLAGAYTELKDYENARMYLEKALKLAEKSGDKSFLASCNMLYGKLHEVKGDYLVASAFFRKSINLYAEIGAKFEQSEALVELANSLLQQKLSKEAIQTASEALKLAERIGSLKVRLDASICLSSCYANEGNHEQAFLFLSNATSLKDSIYTIEKYRTIEEIESSFARSELKIENEALLQNSVLQKQAIRTRNIILLLLGLSLLLGAALLRLIYKQHKEAKRETGVVKQQSEQKIDQLNQDLTIKERELTSKTIFINQKNQLLEKLIVELDELKKTEVSAQSIQHLQVQLKQELSPNAWKEFELSFNEVHPGFQQRLLQNYPELTPAERRLCSFVRLDMNTREISSLSGQSIKSIEVARTRIRKKLGVPHEQNLTNFIAIL